MTQWRYSVVITTVHKGESRVLREGEVLESFVSHGTSKKQHTYVGFLKGPFFEVWAELRVHTDVEASVTINRGKPTPPNLKGNG